MAQCNREGSYQSGLLIEEQWVGAPHQAPQPLGSVWRDEASKHLAYKTNGTEIHRTQSTTGNRYPFKGVLHVVSLVLRFSEKTAI